MAAPLEGDGNDRLGPQYFTKWHFGSAVRARPGSAWNARSETLGVVQGRFRQAGAVIAEPGCACKHIHSPRAATD